MSFSTFTVQDPTTDLLLGKLLGLVSYFDNVDYSEASKLEDLFYWALQGKEVYRVWYGGFKYYAQRVNADQFNIVVREPNRREVTIRTNDYEMLLNPFYGANPQRFGVMFGMASNGIGRRLDSQAQIKIYWKTKVSSGLKEVWDRIRERLTQQQQLAREFNGVSVIGSDDDIKQIQPDYSGSLQNDANLAIEIALSEYGMPRELLYGQSNEVTIIAFAIQKVLPLLKQHDKNIIFNQENFVAYISTTAKGGNIESKSSKRDSEPVGDN
ncbi:virion structural protein [Lactococcus phage 50102]|uniref:Putative portal protein n=1 Tax=Lactococcus phage 50102 TaxID=2024336 RepID=A0A2Z2RXR5_9CAUD|nr:virion structural protein [Lactococcus phage 50102]ASZ70885.1 putative portal protein [Lactococcus phage 50102]